MEMPSRRPHSYINSFSAIEYTVVEGLAGPLHKAKSNKELSTSQPAECSYRYSRSNSQEADFQQAVSTSPKDEQFDLQREAALEELREQLEQIPFKKKYASVTVPLAIRYSTMASRPRSPKKNNELAEQLEQEKLQEELDQSLLKIKEQLSMLTSERVNMEKHMDDLTNDIHEARIQCHNQCQQRYYYSTGTGVRRPRSHSTNTQGLKKKRTPPSQRRPPDKRVSQPSLLSPDSISSSSEYIVQGHKSLGYTDSGYGSLNRRELRARAASFTTSTPNVSLSQGNEYNPTIPELPEGPCFSQQMPSHRLRDRVRSNPTLQYVSHTAPRHHRSQSTSMVPPIISITSSPDLSTRKRHDGKSYQLSHRNSLPETVMNKIVEDEIDSVSVSDTLSQASLSQLTDEGSPKSLNSTVIVRRSSLTGQVEHIRRPRKKHFNGVTEIELKSKSKSLYDPEYRVLNTGYKRNRRNKIILPNSIETTV